MRTWPALDISIGGAGAGPTHGDSGSPGDEIGRPDRLQAALLDYSVAAVDETADDRWRVFFATPADRDAAAAGLVRQFPDLSVHPLDVPDQDWAARSQASMWAVQVGRLIVAPPWDMPSATRGEPNASGPLTVVIQPSMGFGTGHHATTRLCLAALQQLDLRGRRVLDVGTGSGVLAIAASRLGAKPVIGLDDDPDAVQAAQENLALNPGATVTLRVADFRVPGAAGGLPFDVVVANLTGGLLVQAACRLRELAAPAGRLVLSGFMTHEADDVRAAYPDLAVESKADEEGWGCTMLRRGSAEAP